MNDWIKIYEKKTQRKFRRNEKAEFIFDANNGFCEISFEKQKIFVHKICGNGKHWKKFVEYVARNFGIEICKAICIRKNIRAYIRAFGYHITKTNEKNNLKCFHAEDADGNKGIAFECIFEDDKHGYEIFWKVPKAVTK